MATEQNKLSISCFQLSCTENEVEKVFYVRSNWKADPFKDLSGRDEKVICDLSVTDCKSFWSRNVKLIDFKKTKPDNMKDPKDFCEATQAALSGIDKYVDKHGEQELSCHISIDEHHAMLTWSMQQAGTSTMALQFTIGSISLYPVTQFETMKMWEEWIDYFIQERNQLIKSKNTYEVRVNDLEETKHQMQEKIESIISDKIKNQALLIDKFKKVLNTKKKKVKKLVKVLNANGAIMSSELQTSEQHEQHSVEEESSNESESSRHRGKPSRSRSNPISTESPSKKTKLDDESKSTIASESPDEDQEEKLPQKPPQKRSESVLTKTFRGQVIKSRRMGRKPVTRSTRSNDSLDNLLKPVEEQEPNREIEEVRYSEEAADDLLDQLYE